MDIFEKIKLNKGALGQHSYFADGYFMFPKLEGEIAPRMKFRISFQHVPTILRITDM